MPALPIGDFGDVINNTLAAYAKGRLEQTWNFYDTPLLRMLGEQKKTVHGKAHNSGIRLRDKGTFRFTGYFDTQAASYVDVSDRFETAPRVTREDMTWDEKLTEDIQGGDEELADALVEQYEAAEASTVEGLEEALVAPPYNDSAATQNGFRGLLYWLCPLEAGSQDAVGGFNGKTARLGDGTTQTTMAGKDRNVATYNRLRNWVATHGGAMNQGTLDQLRYADINTKFRTLPGLFNPTPGTPKTVRLMPTTFYAAYEKLLDNGRMDIGADAMMQGGKDRLPIRGVPALACPALDDYSYTPVITFSSRNFRLLVWGGRWMKWTKPLRRGGTVWESQLECHANVHCNNPRNGGHVLHGVISA